MFAYFTMIAFVLFILIFEKFAYRANERTNVIVFRNIGFWVIVILITFLSALRYNTGADNLGYLMDFTNISTKKISTTIRNYEIGYFFLNYLLAIFFKEPQVIIITTSVIITILLSLEIKRSSCMPILSLFCYITFYYYFISFNIIRQFIAVSIVFFANRFLLSDKKHHFMKFAIMCYIASLFHYSALVSIITMFFIRKKQTTVIKTIIILMIIVFYIFSSKFSVLIAGIIPRYSEYSYYGRSGGSDSSIIILSIILVVTWFFEKYSLTGKNFYFYQNCVVVGLILNILAKDNIIFSRVAYFYTINLIILIPLLVKHNFLKEKVIIKIFVIIVGILYCLWNLSNNNAGVVPYLWYFNNI